MVNKDNVLTVEDLMIILCDCVDSGTLEMDSPIVLHTEWIDNFKTSVTMQPAYSHCITQYMHNKALELLGTT